MAKIIHTHELDLNRLRGFERDQCYNGLDVCVTHDIFAAMHQQLDPTTAGTYQLERELQGPVLEMRLRGCLIDQPRRLEVIDEFYEMLDQVESDLNHIVLDGVGMPTFNWRSPKDLAKLFYSELGLPPIRTQGHVTVNEDARIQLEQYPIARAIVRHLNVMADLGKKLSVLRTEIDDDGRIRTSYNIAGTSTGRFSSSLSEFGTGGNLQNIEESLRSILIADPSYKFAKFDAKSGESYCVGAIEWNLFGDPTYLDTCESGDPHTAVARFIWPALGWTNNPKRDRETADKPFFRHYSHRFMCKKIGHGSNYNGQPPRIAEETQLPISVIAEFQPRYFAAFPAHKQWHAWVAETLRTRGCLTTLTGRRRYFFKRRNDPKTIREGIAYDPQGSLADIVDQAMLKLWRLGIATIMFQDHDALTFMYPEADEDRVVPILQSELVWPIELAQGRTLRIPYDCETGWNKGHYCCGERKAECKGCQRPVNLDGLREYTGHDPRRRQPQVSILDRIIHRTDRKPRRPTDLPAMDSDIDDSSSVGAESVATDE